MFHMNRDLDSTGEADNKVSAEFSFRKIHLWVLSHEPAETEEVRDKKNVNTLSPKQDTVRFSSVLIFPTAF